MSDATASSAAFELNELLRSSEVGVREAAWERLIAAHTRLLLAVARSFGGGHDEAMDRYSFILEKCRESDFRRLRAFDINGGASFSTWLTIAARRLCLDHDRSRYGRHRATLESGEPNTKRPLRRTLANAICVEIDTNLLPDTTALPADARAIRDERDATLQSALATLTARDRLLLALRFDDDLSASKIAGLLGVPTPFHVYRMLNSVLGRLRALLISRGIDGRDG